MKPAPFTYHRPGKLEDALEILSQVAGQDGRIIAGGQSLVPMMALRLAQPAHLVDINEIPSLRGIEVDRQTLVIRALARHADFHRPAIAGPLGSLLATIAQNIAHYPIRQRGTFCGSLAHADPASEWCLTTVTLGGTVVARSRDGVREIPAETFIDGPMTTALEPDEMISAVHLPVPDVAGHSGFYEFNRRAGDFALGMCLVTFALQEEKNGKGSAWCWRRGGRAAPTHTGRGHAHGQHTYGKDYPGSLRTRCKRDLTSRRCADSGSLSAPDSQNRGKTLS